MTSTHYLSNFVQLLSTKPSATEDALCDSLMLERMGRGLGSKSMRMIHDLTDSTAATKKIKTYLTERGFMFVRLSSATVGILRHENNLYTEGFVEINKLEYSIILRVTGDEALVDEVNAWMHGMFQTSGSLVSTVTGFSVQTGRLTMDTVHLNVQDDNCAEQEFYPFLKLSLDAYFDKFMASKENVLVLYGPPGTGKSTFLRTLIAKKTTNAWLTYNKSVIESDLLVSGFYNSKAQVLALEDIDKYMGARVDGNSLMSSFLNASEGIVLRKDKKIVFSTNLATIDKIDAALLRRGRCFDVIKFELLTVAQARVVEAKMELPPQDLSGKTRWALSEILNPLTADLQASDRVIKSIGF